MTDPGLIARYIGLILLLLLVQIAAIPLIGIGDVVPNIVLIGIVFIALRYGQLPAILFAFGSGLLFDLFVNDVIGLSSLSQTIAAFAAGLYYSDEKAEEAGMNFRFLFITGLAAFLYNTIYILAYFRDITAELGRIFLLHGVGSMLYTTILSMIPVLFLARKRVKVKV